MRFFTLSAIVSGLLLSVGAYAAAPAAAPADAPAGSTGLCKDGSYYSGAEKKGACRGHKGVKTWWGDGSADAKTDKKDTATKEASAAKKSKKADKTEAKAADAAPAAAPAATAPAATAAATAPAKPATKMDAPEAAPAPGGGAGKVWANDSTKVYHCQGDRWYGRTKKGEYLSESDAKAKGFKPDHGKACG